MLFPVELIRSRLEEVLRDDGEQSLTYYGDGGPSEMRLGSLGLRQELAARASSRDSRDVSEDGVMLAHGSTDGLALVVKTVLRPGDGAVVESATYRHTRNFMVAAGADVRPTPIDENGIVIDALKRTLDCLDEAGHPTKLIYTIPTYHAPTGSVLALDRRMALLELAAERDIKILEDNCYYEFNYDESPPPPSSRWIGRVASFTQTASAST